MKSKGTKNKPQGPKMSREMRQARVMSIAILVVSVLLILSLVLSAIANY
jgi:hypothetical protein